MSKSPVSPEGRLLIAISKPSAVVALLGALVVWIPGVTEAPAFTSAVCVPGAAFFALTIFMVRRGWTRVASWLLLAVIFGAATLVSLLFGGLKGPNPSVYLVFVLFAGLLRGWRTAIGAAALAGLVMAGMLAADLLGVLPRPLSSTTPGVGAAIYGGIIVMVTAFLGAYLRHLDEALEASAKATNAARRSERRVAEMISESPDGVLFLAPGGEILDCNRRVEAFTGKSEEQLVGHQAIEALGMTREAAGSFAEAFATVVEQGQPRLVEIELEPSGDLEAHLNLVHHGAGDATVQMVARDISLRRRAQKERDQARRQLRATRRMEALGRLAGGVAHDFNNLLTLLLAHSEEISEDERLPAGVRELARQMLETSERASGLTGQLLAFARKQVLEPRTIKLDDVVSSLEPLLAKLVREDITLIFRVEVGAPDIPVLADPSQLEQVLINLVVNARDAMPEGGAVTVTVKTVEIDRDQGQLPRGSYALLEVSDTGLGMSAKTLEHVFDPFFTTRSSQGGTGLGLATVHGIVNQSGGEIGVRSEPGQGTTFHIHLPLAEGEEVVLPAPERAIAPAGKASVLVVDDDSTVRETVARALGRAGYRVSTAADGTLALALIESSAGPIDLLITDVVMPNMGGRALAEAFGRRHPAAPVLFISGHADAPLTSGEEPVREGQHFLSKPVRPSELLARVAAILSEHDSD